jgi:hypothetical protein
MSQAVYDDTFRDPPARVSRSFGDGTMVISPAPRDAWSDVVASDPDALPSHTPEWIDAVCDRSPWRDVSRYYVTPSGRHIVLPLTSLGVGEAASIASPRRGWGFGGIVADGGVTRDDIAAVSADLTRHRSFKLHIRPNPLQARLWESFAPELRRVDRVAYALDLSGGPGPVWARLNRGARRRVIAAERHGVSVETAASGDLLPIFFELTYKSRARWAEKQHEPVWLAQLRGRVRDSQAKWQNIARHLGPRLSVSVAWYRGDPLAASIDIRGGNVHAARGAMDWERGRHLGASHLLNWCVIEAACAAGARWFHLGESATTGAADFNRFLGAQRFPFQEFNRETIPISHAQRAVRSVVKKAIGFREH